MPQPKLYNAGAPDSTRGITPIEPGISAESVDVTFTDEKDYLLDEWGGRRAVAVSWDSSRTIDISGQVVNDSATDAMQAEEFGVPFVTAQVFADQYYKVVPQSGGPAPDWTSANWLLDSATASKARDGWLSTSASATEVLGLALS